MIPIEKSFLGINWKRSEAVRLSEAMGLEEKRFGEKPLGAIEPPSRFFSIGFYDCSLLAFYSSAIYTSVLHMHKRNSSKRSIHQ